MKAVLHHIALHKQHSKHVVPFCFACTSSAQLIPLQNKYDISIFTSPPLSSAKLIDIVYVRDLMFKTRTVKTNSVSKAKHD